MKDQELLLQAQILTQLHENREKGAEMLLETYTSLLWSVCQRRLSDPEDIKECINDVFAQFCMNLDKFDPEQISLKNYLAMLADRRAISYFRSNQRRGRAENAAVNQDTANQDSLHLELEEALAQLKPEDAQIIRLKYYNGMTYREIAERMGIGEEAAKKRGGRSLRKLAKWLIIGLLLASLLAGCAYVVHRYFRYSKGVGISWDSDVPIYQLAEVPEPVISNGVARHLLNVSYSDDSLVVIAAFYPVDDSLSTGLYYNLKDAYTLWCEGVTVIDSTYSSDVMEQYSFKIPRDSMKADENGEIHIQIRFQPKKSSSDSIKKDYGYDMDMSELSWDITLEETDVLQDLTELGSYLQTDYADFLIVTDWEFSPQTEDTYTLVTLYPVYKNEGYSLSDLVSTGYTMLGDREMELISLTDASGKNYPLFRTAGHSSGSAVSAYTIWFQNVPPGEYTLNIPSFCYAVTAESHTFTLPLPKEDHVFLPCDETIQLPYHAGLHITGVNRQSSTQSGVFMIESWEDGVQMWDKVEDTKTMWHYAFDYDLTEDEDFPLYGIRMVTDYSYVTESGYSPIIMNSQMTGYDSGLDDITLGIRDGLGMDAPDAITITFEVYFYADVQDYSVPIKIK